MTTSTLERPGLLVGREGPDEFRWGGFETGDELWFFRTDIPDDQFDPWLWTCCVRNNRLMHMGMPKLGVSSAFVLSVPEGKEKNAQGSFLWYTQVMLGAATGLKIELDTELLGPRPNWDHPQEQPLPGKLVAILRFLEPAPELGGIPED